VLSWLWGAEEARRVRLVEIGLAVLLGARIVLSPFRGLADQPDALFRPVFFWAWSDGMPPVGAIVALQAIGAVAAGCVLTTRGPSRRIGFALAWLCLLLLAGLRASQGKIMHNDLLLIFACIPFLFAPADLALDDRRPSPRWGWTLRVALVIISAAYFLAGWAKLTRSGPAWVFSDNMQWALRGAGVSGKAPFPELSHWVADQPWSALGTAAFIMGLELCFPVILFWPRSRPLFALGAIVLHALTWVLLGLDYWTWAAVVPLLLIDWPHTLARRRDPIPA